MQLYLSVFEEVQGDLDILQLVEAHASFLPWLQRRTHQPSGGVHTANMKNNPIFQRRARPNDCGRDSQTPFITRGKMCFLPVMATLSSTMEKQFKLRFDCCSEKLGYNIL